MKRTRLRSLSDKQAERLKVYNRVKAEYLKANPTCEFVTTDGYANYRCKSKSKDIHHKMGRGRYTADVKYFMAVCREHHDWIENNKKAARLRGYILYK